MGLVLREWRDEGTWEKVAWNGVELEVLAGRPSHLGLFEAFMQPDGAGELQSRIDSVVRDWRGVVDEAGRNVPYSFEGLCRLIRQVPALLPILAGIAYAKAFPGTSASSSGSPGSVPVVAEGGVSGAASPEAMAASATGNGSEETSRKNWPVPHDGSSCGGSGIPGTDGSSVSGAV